MPKICKSITAVLRPFLVIFFCQVPRYLSQNSGFNGHFEGFNLSKSWLDQKLWHKTQLFLFLFFCKLHEISKKLWIYEMLLSSNFMNIFWSDIVQAPSIPHFKGLGMRNLKYEIEFAKRFIFIKSHNDDVNFAQVFFLKHTLLYFSCYQGY